MQRRAKNGPEHEMDVLWVSEEGLCEIHTG